MRDVMTIEQVATYLQVEAEDVEYLIDERRLPTFEPVPGAIRVPLDALRRWISRQEAAHATEPGADEE
jgi:excisionase family DNA binding protein